MSVEREMTAAGGDVSDVGSDWEIRWHAPLNVCVLG